MMALEGFLVKVARAGNLLFFFVSVFAAFKVSGDMPADWRFLVVVGSIISAAILCGLVALFFRMNDQMEAQTVLAKSLLIAGRDSSSALASIDSIAKRVAVARTKAVPPQ